MVLRAVWLVALRLDGVVFQKVAQEPPPWPVGVLVVAPMGWCCKKLSQNPNGSMGWCSKSWGGAPKNCPRIPAARWGGVLKVGVVFKKVVPESPRLDGVVFQKLGWCSKNVSQNPHYVYYSGSTPVSNIILWFQRCSSH